MLKKNASSVFWLSIFLGIPIYLWIWSIGTQLQSDKVKVNEIKLILFKISVIYPIAYFVFAIYYMFTNGWIIEPLHFVAMFCTLYAMIFAAKTIKSAELEKEAKVSDYLGDFFLVWFFPIGIWILQPRIHKLIDK
ncbi:MAG TPA: hypothetical protein P5514_13300 [Bacteroidales bacterium]|nr:hypothetical protein [Bacteroidales bacterium]HRX97918.1 hypothetical protein [Bacteroidales bacterium]